MSEDRSLKELRELIDNLDAELLTKINERAKLAQEVGRVKERNGDPVFYRPEREAQVLERIKNMNAGPLSDEETARLFRELMSACLALEMPMNIAFLGPEGTYTQTAALKHFGHSVTTVPLAAIDEVFREVESGSAHYGVVPVENSTEGMVNQTLDLFLQSPLRICGEVQLRIHHHLLSNVDEMSKIKRIYSHQQSLAQCREWLNTHMPAIEQRVVSSNAAAAKLAASEEGAAAIAGETAGEIYQLRSLAVNIEDDPNNTTRFFIVGKQATQPSGKDKTSLLISVKNRPGALYDLLEPFRKQGVSLTRIESRPSRRGMWDYVFFLDLEGHELESPVKDVLINLNQNAAMLKVLGAYPCAALT